jgi:hypothetical protein
LKMKHPKTINTETKMDCIIASKTVPSNCRKSNEGSPQGRCFHFDASIYWARLLVFLFLTFISISTK